MKLTVISILSALIVAPAAFAGNCDKADKDKDCDKKKDEATLVADCGKCKKDCDKKDAEKDDEATLAGCDKCKKDGDKDGADKDDATMLAGGCKKDCDKDDAEKDDEATMLA